MGETNIVNVLFTGYNCVCKAGCRYVVNFGGQNVQCAKCSANEVKF